ncbi:MAG: hypothetical protein LBR76_02185 [Oscillospiraceae bacterium]|jgi:predicted phage-related endonuclease|nr:hypothetical protein [Oscillospiraceae bacterium]
MHEIAKQVAEYKSLKTSIKDLEFQLSEIEGVIKAYMGDMEELQVDGTTVRWKTVAQNRFDTASFKAQHEALYERFLIRGETRRFTVN